MTTTRRPLHHVRKVFTKTHDPLWQMQSAVLVIIGLQLLTSNSFLPFHKFWMVIVEVVLLLALVVVTTEGYRSETSSRRNLAIILTGIITAINIFSLILLINALFNGQTADITGRGLLLNGVVIYTTNVLLFALWYWELDGGGPERRALHRSKPDFLFPQMVNPQFANPGWLPGFADYSYLSATNVTNFASSDTLPLSHRAKLLMMVQSLVSLVTVVLVLARAINILQ
jgi:uncharacterized membrane protein